MGFAATTPNFTGVALLQAELLQLLTADDPNISLRDLYLRVLLDNPLSTHRLTPATDRFTHYSLRHTRPPVAMLASHSADTLWVGLSGAQGTVALQDAVFQYVDGEFSPPFSDPQNNDSNRPNFRSWAADYWDDVIRVHPVANMNIRICGHSLGGVIGLYMAQLAILIPSVQSVHLCTFGAPKSWNVDYNTSNSIIYARWINPEDNVPKLPPSPAQAPEIWSLLSRSQQLRVLAWRHPCRGAQVTSTGALSLTGDQASIPLSLNTILQAMNSPAGVTGPGHGIATYISYLRSAQGGVGPLSNTAPIAPQVVTPATPALPPNSNVPSTQPALPAPVDNTARRTAFTAAAHARNVPEPFIPSPAKMHVVKLDGMFALEWMGYIIAYGPTKKKSRACAAHFNKFLTPFIGVGSCDTGAFVGALTDWMNEAADPDMGFVPTLNNNGVPFVLPIG